MAEHATLRVLTEPCSEGVGRCDKRATHMVVNRYGEDVRACCHDHAVVLQRFLNGTPARAGATPQE